MPFLPTFGRIGYEDNSGRVTEVRYRLIIELEDDFSNITDVINGLHDLKFAASVITSDKLSFVRLEVELGEYGTAEDYSNNQIVAFVRGDYLGTPLSFEVPSWDSASYERDENNLLDAAFISDATNMGTFITGLDNGYPQDNIQWAQSRARKGRKTLG